MMNISKKKQISHSELLNMHKWLICCCCCKAVNDAFFFTEFVCTNESVYINICKPYNG